MAEKSMEAITLNDYQQGAMLTARWAHPLMVTYPVLALAGEAGEVANEWKKVLRGDYNKPDEEASQVPEAVVTKMVLELGDVLYYVAAAAHDLGYTLEDVARMNRQKLIERHGA